MPLETTKPVVLTVAGVDPSGGAGIIADVKTITALGGFPAAAVTALTFQNTQGVYGVRIQTAEDVVAQITSVADDFTIAAMKTGMLPSGSVIAAVAKLVREGVLPSPVVDPVVVATSGDRLISDRALKILIKELLPVARLVTPNIPEAEMLIEKNIESEDDMCAASEAICNMGAKAVLIKGGHKKGKGTKPATVAVDILWENGRAVYFRAPMIDTRSTHGTGCTLSAALAACLANGLTLHAAVSAAKSFVHEGIIRAPRIGKGNGPIDHGWKSSHP
jgi:hydroxymethylpyrimidine kinase/phosphomethylpyrimidine kinase